MWLLTDAGWCQFKRQQDSPIWGVVKKETSFNVKGSMVMQHGCENSMAVRLPWGQSPSQWSSSALWWFDCSALPTSQGSAWSALLHTSLQLGSHNFQSKVESTLPVPEGEESWLKQTEILTLGPWWVSLGPFWLVRDLQLWLNGESCSPIG